MVQYRPLCEAVAMKRLFRISLAALAALTPAAGSSETAPEALFNAATGLRIAAYRAPVPDTVPGGRAVDAGQVAVLAGQGALLIDALPAPGHKLRKDGSWITPETHVTLPGAHWLPEIGRGDLTPDIRAYLTDALAGCAPAQPMVIFCRNDCWMSWNAVQHIAAMGFTDLAWYADGIEDWADHGHPTEPADPLPMGASLCQ